MCGVYCDTDICICYTGTPAADHPHQNTSSNVINTKCPPLHTELTFQRSTQPTIKLVSSRHSIFDRVLPKSLKANHCLLWELFWTALINSVLCVKVWGHNIRWAGCQCNTNRLELWFIPTSITLLNKEWSCFGHVSQYPLHFVWHILHSFCFIYYESYPFSILSF